MYNNESRGRDGIIGQYSFNQKTECIRIGQFAENVNMRGSNA